jgi:anti-anti-sigma factor
VVLDLGAVTFIDAFGLGTIVSTAERLDQAGSELTIRGASSFVKRMLTITGVHPLLAEPPER